MYFSSSTVSFKNSSCTFLCLGFDLSSGCSSGRGSTSGSSYGARVFIGNDLFLKFLGTFSLAVRNNFISLGKRFFSTDFGPLSIFLISLANLLCS